MRRSNHVLERAAGTWFTGAVARIERAGQLVFERAYGATSTGASARPVYVDTRFDLASLTKLFVATHALHAVAEEKVTLDAPLVPWFPEWENRAHAAITLRMLLAHTSGMNSGADYRQLLGDNVERFAIARELVAEPGERVIYSDLGFIAVGVLLERLYGKTLATLCPGYRPRLFERSAIPATEEDAWRGRLQGVVHDEKAYLMGGIAGHAGLFGTARDVASLTELYLAAMRKPLKGNTGFSERRSSGHFLWPSCSTAFWDKRSFEVAVLANPKKSEASREACIAFQRLLSEAITEQAYDPVLRRGLGWALKTTDDNSCGRHFSMQSFGHTGFVGTCVWADPVRDVQAVLLTNSVYFGRKDIRDLRAAFYEAVMEDLA